jgi:uncharacterized protein YhdP
MAKFKIGDTVEFVENLPGVMCKSLVDGGTYAECSIDVGMDSDSVTCQGSTEKVSFCRIVDAPEVEGLYTVTVVLVNSAELTIQVREESLRLREGVS